MMTAVTNQAQQQSQHGEHESVLLQETLAAMSIKPDGLYLDGTFGRGGHSAAILEKLGADGHLIALDRDPQAIEVAQQKFAGDTRFAIYQRNFSQMSELLQTLGLSQQVDAVLLDLGVSSPQLDQAQRGFSFMQNGPLDMRMNPQEGQSAAAWLQQADQQEISRVLWEYGEERFSRRIAARIVEFRQQDPINDTHTLANLISECVPAGKQKKHPATRSFQAIRIHVNQELAQIESALAQIFDVLKPGGLLLVISFHSLEDRIVKRFFKRHSTKASVPRGLPLRDDQIEDTRRLKLIGKAMKAGPEELSRNPRARSAVLRVCQRTA